MFGGSSGGDSGADGDSRELPVATVLDKLAEVDSQLLHFAECPMTGKPWDAEMSQYEMICRLLQRMIKAEHGQTTVPAPIDDDTYLTRGWLGCISEWKALLDSGDGLGDYSRQGRLVKDRRSGKAERELVPGKVWLAQVEENQPPAPHRHSPPPATRCPHPQLLRAGQRNIPSALQPSQTQDRRPRRRSLEGLAGRFLLQADQPVLGLAVRAQPGCQDLQASD